MGLTAGIVGLPNVGKSTLFNAITKSKILAANYPFATIEPNVGIVEVKDEEKFFKVIKASFMQKRKTAFIIAGVILVLGILSMVIRGFNLDIDFAGGSELSITIGKTVNEEEIKRKSRVFNEFSVAVDRMIAGEYLDTELEGKQISKEILQYIHYYNKGSER